MNTTAFLLGLVASLPFSGASAAPGPELNLLSGGVKARGVVTCFYSGRERTPAVVVRVDSIYTDYERRGFFRIGVLPLGVLEGLTLDVRRHDAITNSLAQMQNWLRAQAGQRIEFRRVTLQTDAGNSNRLESSQARILSQGRWELFGQVQYTSGTNVWRAPRAVLQVTGPRSGEVIFATDPPRTNHLFGRLPIPTPEQKENYEDKTTDWNAAADSSRDGIFANRR